MTGRGRIARGTLRPIAGRRGVLGGGAGMVSLFVVLLLIAPASAARGSVVFNAPFTGFTTGVSSFVDWVGCASERTAAVGTWNQSANLYQFQGYAHGGTCLSDSDAYTDSITSISSPLFAAPQNGSGDVFVSVNTSFSARAELMYQQTRTFGDADVIFVLSGYVYDLTHHSATQVGYSYNYLVSQDLTGYLNGSWSYSQGWTNEHLTVPVDFVPHHVYVFVFYLTAYCEAASDGGGTIASASLDLAGSHGLRLTAISVY
jgi:hypothetical protein